MFDQSRARVPSADTDELVAAFLSVRRAVGLIGISLPIMLYLSARVVPGGQMQPSISEFYHTPMGDVLVGALVALGVFLISYFGHKPLAGDKITDWWVSTIAGVAAIGVALIPAIRTGTDCSLYEPPTVIQGFTQHWCTGWYHLHLGSAVVYFICMAIFCLLLFPRDKTGGVRYFNEAGNITYFICGIIILGSMLALLVFFLIQDTPRGEAWAAANFVFWFESLPVLAFGVAWLTKGNLIGGIGNAVARRSGGA